jgi:16S rRNA A1518/A1519 N6-dimethyltransferase RsmA/KsgA/DIM1 with predicted DNA glycosylase/AP lyase activity
MSLFYQIKILQKLKPESIIEIGPGSGNIKAICTPEGLKIETLDLDEELKQEKIGSAHNMPFKDGVFETVCAFQMLEQLPYD